MSQQKPPIDFDIDRYMRASKRLDLSEVDWDDVPNHELSDGDIMCMHYMMDIETHTMIYLRDLLATRAANDPHITAFLSCWLYEELWHGEAFSDFLRAYGLEVPAEPKLPDGSTPMPTRPNRVFKNFWTPVGAGVKSQEEVDALGLYLFADSDEGREAVRGIDEVVSDMTGLGGLTLLEDAIDEAVERARRKPGWAGVAAPSANGQPAGASASVSAAS